MGRVADSPSLPAAEDIGWVVCNLDLFQVERAWGGTSMETRRAGGCRLQRACCSRVPSSLGECESPRLPSPFFLSAGGPIWLSGLSRRVVVP